MSAVAPAAAAAAAAAAEEGCVSIPLLTTQTPDTLLPPHTAQRQQRSPSLSTAAPAFVLALEVSLVVGLVYLFDWVFHNPTCNAMFRCGCTWNWAGSWDACNIHVPNGPHCPWCAAPPSTAWTTFILVRTAALAAYLIVSRLIRSWPRAIAHLTARNLSTSPPSSSSCPSMRSIGLAAALAAAPFVAAAAAWIATALTVGWFFFLASPGYPYFLWYTRSH